MLRISDYNFITSFRVCIDVSLLLILFYRKTFSRNFSKLKTNKHPEVKLLLCLCELYTVNYVLCELYILTQCVHLYFSKIQSVWE